MAEPIRFYSKTTAYQELSNFAPFGFEEDGMYWPTVEHYFQAQKFPGMEKASYREKIRAAGTPQEAIMLHALRRKFAAEELRELLLATGERPLIEASPFDSYWGCGRSGKGKNRLGQLLMQVRAGLRARGQ